jgi:regulator of sirC expression with transglutaminase-like and TPR domain
MARAAAKGGRRPQPNAPRDRQRGRGRRQLSAGEQQLFFSRIRRQAKWVFVLLALVFAGGFVFLGVGSGSSGLDTFFRDVFRGGGSSGPSVSKAEKEVAKHPTSPKGYRDLATAYQRNNRTADAIGALQRYTSLRPKDATVLGELAGLQLSQATSTAQETSALQAQQAEAMAGSTFGPSSSSKLGKALGADPISSSVSSSYTSQANSLYSRQQAAYADALRSYEQLARLQPDQPTIQFQLAQAAESARQIPIAVAAYKRYIKLDPQSSIVPQVKARIAQLQPPPKKKQAAGVAKGGKG